MRISEEQIKHITQHNIRIANGYKHHIKQINERLFKCIANAMESVYVNENQQFTDGVDIDGKIALLIENRKMWDKIEGIIERSISRLT